MDERVNGSRENVTNHTNTFAVFDKKTLYPNARLEMTGFTRKQSTNATSKEN